MNAGRFAGKTAIVTGGSSGIGYAAAKRLLEDGAAHVVLFSRNADKLAKAAGSLDQERCEWLSVDVSDESQVKEAVKTVAERHGAIDYLVNMAGIPGPSARVENYTFEDFRRVYEINVFGTFLMMKYCLPYMQRNGSGAIVNASSCSGMRGYELEIGYGSSKAAILQMTMNAANENGRNGVRINCISPGWVDTNMLDDILANYAETDDGGYTKENLRCGTMTRPSTAEEMANVICFLLSDEARYVNGANYVCDGGKTLG